jgi:hypothetical protein
VRERERQGRTTEVKGGDWHNAGLGKQAWPARPRLGCTTLLWHTSTAQPRSRARNTPPTKHSQNGVTAKRVNLRRVAQDWHEHARSFLPNPPLGNAHMGKTGLTSCSASPHRRSWQPRHCEHWPEDAPAVATPTRSLTSPSPPFSQADTTYKI